MKKILVLSLLTLFAVSCISNTEKKSETNNKESELKTSLKSNSLNESDKKISAQQKEKSSESAFIIGDQLHKVDFSALAPESQKFSIDPQTDNILSCKSGTRFLIPAFSFPGQSRVDINIREYHSKESAYINNLSTLTSDGKILESAGMFNIEASVNNVKTNLSQGAEIYIETPSEVSSDMGIFYGNTNSEGNVLWDFDPNGTEPTPIVVSSNKYLSRTTKDELVKMYKLDKQSMLKLIGKTLEVSFTFEPNGEIIGKTLCTETDPLMQKACQEMHETFEKADKKLFASSFRRTLKFEFVCKSMKEYLTEKNKETSLTELDKALIGFGNSKLGRKYFAIRRIGNINIDRFIPMPDLTERRDVMVKASSKDVENCKLIFTNNKTLMNASYKDGYFIFKGLPIGTEYKVLSTLADKNSIYIGSSSGIVQKEKNNQELSYAKVDEKDLASKIADICN